MEKVGAPEMVVQIAEDGMQRTVDAALTCLLPSDLLSPEHGPLTENDLSPDQLVLVCLTGSITDDSPNTDNSVSTDDTHRYGHRRTPIYRH